MSYNCDHNAETCLKCVIEKSIANQTKGIVEALIAIAETEELRKEAKRFLNCPYSTEDLKKLFAPTNWKFWTWFKKETK